MAEIEKITLNGVLCLIEEAVGGDLFNGLARVELVAVEVFGEETVALGGFLEIVLGGGVG